MLELGPAFIKVGQVLSTRPDIVPPVYADVFGTLQDEIPEGAGGDPKHVVAEELGDKLDQSTLEPVASGSLAYVYTADYQGGSFSIVVASIVMFPRALVEVAVVNPALLPRVVVPLGVMTGVGVLIAGIVYWQSTTESTVETDLKNPFRLRPALFSRSCSSCPSPQIPGSAIQASMQLRFSRGSLTSMRSRLR
ncbi:hypothetical protein GCM10009067_33050 [Haloarcula sebkhae]|uniref:DUF4010 domain-containing protein n=1 Tax=Haloarcula sebkhae TaxID=932660 RepID=A0A830F5Q1_9EURY|nr:hypothetical protein GCM10009067_33050 [Haloarcula sebkhae]